MNRRFNSFKFWHHFSVFWSHSNHSYCDLDWWLRLGWSPGRICPSIDQIEPSTGVSDQLLFGLPDRLIESCRRFVDYAAVSKKDGSFQKYGLYCWLSVRRMGGIWCLSCNWFHIVSSQPRCVELCHSGMIASCSLLIIFVSSSVGGMNKYKLVFLGDVRWFILMERSMLMRVLFDVFQQAVGKTSIITQFMYDTFDCNYQVRKNI